MARENQRTAADMQTPESATGFRFIAGDRVLWIIIAALTVISVLVVYSSTAKMAYDAHTARSTAHFLRQQLVILVISIPLLITASKINCRIYNHLAGVGYAACILLTLSVYFIGATTNGAARWIPLGPFQFQPSEALKVATVLLLARQLAGRQSRIDRVRIIPSLNPLRWKRPDQRKIWREGMIRSLSITLCRPASCRARNSTVATLSASEGWNWKGPSGIQRAAPLVVAPMK